MASDQKAPEADQNVESGEKQTPVVRPDADGALHYYFPVEITVVKQPSEAQPVYYHFPVEIVMEPSASAVDVDAIADLVMDKLAQQLEGDER